MNKNYFYFFILATCPIFCMQTPEQKDALIKAVLVHMIKKTDPAGISLILNMGGADLIDQNIADINQTQYEAYKDRTAYTYRSPSCPEGQVYNMIERNRRNTTTLKLTEGVDPKNS